MTGLLPSQPSSRELVTTLRDMRTPLACAAAEEISGLREANHHYRDSAARDEKLIATLTARVEALEKALRDIIGWKEDTLGERPKAHGNFDCPPEITEAFDRGSRMAFYRCALRASAVLQPKGAV